MQYVEKNCDRTLTVERLGILEVTDRDAKITRPEYAELYTIASVWATRSVGLTDDQ